MIRRRIVQFALSVPAVVFLAGCPPVVVDEPNFSPVPGVYSTDQTVSISDSPKDSSAGAVIYYTTDGDTPTSSALQYTGAITVSGPSTVETIKAIAVVGASHSGVATAVYTVTYPAVATPTFSPTPGSYASSQSITISDATPGALIRYTTDGSSPTASSTPYTEPISVSGAGTTETIKAIGMKSGMSISQTATAVYTIQSQVALPTFSPPAGTYSSDQLITISDTTQGAAIYYTTDGSAPTTSSARFSAPIPVAGTGTLLTVKAYATSAGLSDSPIASAAYTIAYNQVSTPQFNPPAGTYGSSQLVSINDATSGASIFYTTDGSTPGTGSFSYSGSITVPADETLKAVATKNGMADSPVGTAIYIILPPPPAGVSVVAGNEQATISWQPVAIATSYNLYWSSSPGVTKTSGTKVSGVTSPFKLSGLANGATYYFIVTAFDADGESGVSSQVNATPSSSSSGALSTTPPEVNTITISGPASVNALATAVTYTATYSGTAAAYRWYIDGTLVAGETGASLMLNPSLLAYSSHVVTLMVTDVSGVVYSGSVTISFFTGSASGGLSTTPPPQYLLTVSGPTSASTAASSVTFTSNFNGSPASYQWYLDGTAVVGGTGSSVAMNPSQMSGALHLVTLFLTDVTGITYSTGVTLSLVSSAASGGIVIPVVPPVYVVTISGPASVSNAATSATYTSSYSGTPSTRQWFLDGVAVASGGTGPSLTLNPSHLSGPLHLITLFVKDQDGFTYSASFDVSIAANSGSGGFVNPSPPPAYTVTVSGPAAVSTSMSSATFISSYNGTPVSFQWYLDGLTVTSGGTGPSLVVRPATLSGPLHLVALFVRDVNGFTYSGSRSFSLYNDSSTGPVTTILPSSNAVTVSGPAVISKAGFSATFTSTYSGNAASYQWYWDGAKITGGDALVLSTSTLTTGLHLLTLFVTDTSGVRYSAGMNVEVTP